MAKAESSQELKPSNFSSQVTEMKHSLKSQMSRVPIVIQRVKNLTLSP